MQAVGQAISVVLTDPVIIPAHFENRAINASNSFAVAFDSGNLTSAGEAVGQMVYDIQTIAGTAAMAYTTTGNVAKATNTFIRANEFRSPIVLQYDTARLNSGFPIDTIKFQNPVVKKGNPANSAAGDVAQTEAIIGATQENIVGLEHEYLNDFNFNKNVIESLKDFGVYDSQIDSLSKGKQVIFEDHSTKFPTATIFQVDGKTLKAGIWDVIADKPGVLRSFAQRVKNLAVEMGCDKIEFFGCDIQNQRLLNILKNRYGFSTGEPIIIEGFGFKNYEVSTVRKTIPLELRSEFNNFITPLP